MITVVSVTVIAVIITHTQCPNIEWTVQTLLGRLHLSVCVCCKLQSTSTMWPLSSAGTPKVESVRSHPPYLRFWHAT